MTLYFITPQDSCFDARRHLEQVMNPYILNVSMATQLCSKALCQSRGRCVRKKWNDDVFLHLDPMRYRIQRQRRSGQLTVSGGLSLDDINWFGRHFDCMCYSQEPCRSDMTFNTIYDVAASTRGGAADRPRLLVMTLLCLKMIVMSL